MFTSLENAHMFAEREPLANRFSARFAAVARFAVPGGCGLLGVLEWLVLSAGGHQCLLPIAAVGAGSLALRDANVPTTAAVAAVSVGVRKSAVAAAFYGAEVGLRDAGDTPHHTVCLRRWSWVARRR